MKEFGQFCYMMLILVASVIISGLMFAQMYEWFISKPFNLPQIGNLHAMGITTFIVLIKGKRRSLKESSKEKDSVIDVTSEFIYQLLMNLFILFIGYIITLLM